MLRIMLYVVVGVLALSFFGISIQSIVYSPAGQENFGYLGELISAGFDIVQGFAGAVFAWFNSLMSS